MGLKQADYESIIFVNMISLRDINSS